MDESMAAAQAARERVEEQIREAEQRRDAVHGLAQDVRELLATVTSRGGEVTVSAQPGGRITAVEITGAGVRLGPDRISRLVTETIATAQHAAAMQAVRLSAGALGEGSPLLERLAEEAGAAFPAPDGGITWTG